MNFVINLLKLFIKLILDGFILSHSIAKHSSRNDSESRKKIIYQKVRLERIIMKLELQEGIVSFFIYFGMFLYSYDALGSATFDSSTPNICLPR